MEIEKIESCLDAGQFARALAGIKKTSAGDGRGRLLFMKGEAFRGLGLFAKALEEYSRAKRAAHGDMEFELEALIGEARCARALGRESLALASAKKALALSGMSGVCEKEAGLEWALALRLSGRLAEASGLLVKLLKEYRGEGDHGGAAFTLWALGGLYRLQGRYKEGIRAFESALAEAKKDGDESAAGYALFGLGGILRVAGFMGRALNCYVRARKIFAGTDDAFARAYAECGTANVLRQLGRLEEAWAGYVRAHKLYSGLSDQADLGFVEWGLGEIRKKNGDFRGAREHYRKAAALFKGRSEPRGEALTMLSLSALYYLTGDVPKAERQHALAMKFIRRHGLHTHLEVFT